MKVKIIGEEAFAGSTLTSVTLESGINIIGPSAFAEMPNLNDIVIPGTVKIIGTGAFAGRSNLNFSLRSVELNNGLETIENGAFAFNRIGSSSIKLRIPDTVTSIGDFAFFGNELTEISIPNSVVSIGTGAFDNNPLETITIGENPQFDLCIARRC